jgi:thiamine biosynthesis protein ThiS
MDVVVNGEKKSLLGQKHLNNALISWGYNPDGPMAVAVNYTVIPNTAYHDVALHEHDVIEILMPMQGG